MGFSVDVTSSNYATEVLEKSFEKPVLVDFFATWCGPCQLLKPTLEKLAKEYDFVLAKVDIDRNQDLANNFQIEGVPDVRIVTNGDMIPGFVGVLPEIQLREMLARLNLKSELDIGLEEARVAMASEDISRAKQLFEQLIAKYPEHQSLVIEVANFLVHINEPEEATTLLDTIECNDREYFPRAQAIRALIQFKQQANPIGESELDQLFAQASRLVVEGHYEAALKIFLEIVSKHRNYRDDGARKSMIAVFDVLGNDHPLTKKYQRELMLSLY
ncbi:MULTISPECIES: tetratricopeptide repeat protein [Moorena]|uniref:tetratricopeptide repeat protein n=1 Tax=Moorena TaxID=1155738 RepID=UPI00142C01AF|nr:tetratricopeptide repeat protein [Moorena sp. SIO4G3]NEO80288.1 tetratricopeptide repeat protein [Moorena sp. SIO4G3]